MLNFVPRLNVRLQLPSNPQITESNRFAINSSHNMEDQNLEDHTDPAEVQPDDSSQHQTPVIDSGQYSRIDNVSDPISASDSPSSSARPSSVVIKLMDIAASLDGKK